MRFALVVLAVLAVGCGGSNNNGTGGGGGSGGGAGGGGGGVATCDSTNCAGCCFNNTCQTGTTDTACGKFAVACQTCNGAAGAICLSTQLCGVDPSSMWKVQPTAATITPTNNGASWDGDNSGPDVYVVLTCPHGTGTPVTTPAVQDSYSPTWTTGGCTMKASDLEGAGFDFQALDQDVVSDDSVCQAQNLTGITEQFLLNGGVDIQPTGGLMTLHFALTKQ